MDKKTIGRIFDLLVAVLIVSGVYIGVMHNLASGIGLMVVACILIQNKKHEQLKQRVKQLESKQNKFL